MDVIILALLFTGYFIQAATTLEISARKDNFVRSAFDTWQTRLDDQNNQWQRKVDINQLHVLDNDALLGRKHSCYEQVGKLTQPTDGKSFEDVAKAAGFGNVFHRKKSIKRPNCRFDSVLQTTNPNVTLRLPGEVCLMEGLSGGGAIGDFNNDGFPDIFFGVADDRSRLFQNNGDGTFSDVTTATKVGPEHYGNAAIWFDADADGDLDLFVSTIGDNRHYFYINQGGRFTEEALSRGVSLQFPDGRNIAGFTPTVGDFDLDGYVDLFVSEWIFHNYGKTTANRLFRNLGATKPGYFEDVTDSAGVNMDVHGHWRMFLNHHASGTFVFGASLTDFNNDNYPDLLISADFYGSKLFWNNKNGTFTMCNTCHALTPVNAMGHTTGDLNNDGYMDVFLSGLQYTKTACLFGDCEMFPGSANGLFLNNKNQSFQDIAKDAGVLNGSWAWGTAFLDFDNDGRLDLMEANGLEVYSTSLEDEYNKVNMFLWHNRPPPTDNSTTADDDSQIKFVDVARQQGIYYEGQGRGLAVFDMDRDGDEDVVVFTNYGPIKLFRNSHVNTHNWLRVDVKHRCLNNTIKLCDSIGARVTIISKNYTKHAVYGSRSHFLSQSESTTHFGMGNESESVTVRVFWPATESQLTVTDVRLNELLTVVQPMTKNDTIITWSQIHACPHLVISAVTQPSRGKVTVNTDRHTLHYDPSPQRTFDVGQQLIKYDIEVEPSSWNVTGVKGVEVDFDMRVVIPFTRCKHTQPNNQAPIQKTDTRTFDGASNNLDNTEWGARDRFLMSVAPRQYADNISLPASACSPAQRASGSCRFPKEFRGLGSSRPSPRLISNELMSQKGDVFSKRNMSDLTMHFGQFISHEMDHTSMLPRFEFEYFESHVWMPITVPKGDIHFDPYNTGKEEIPFLRSQYNKCTGNYPSKVSRQQINHLSSYIDGGTVYGINEKRCATLREYKRGLLKLQNNLLPKNDDALANENPTGRPSNQLFVAGDIRANVQPGLMAMHVLFVREHNRLADKFSRKHPDANDEEIFQNARRLLIAELQAITYNEYLPSLLGEPLPPYPGYNESLDASVTHEFTTAAFRYGHSQVGVLVYRLGADDTPIKEGHALLRETYFRPHIVEREGGVDPLFRGMVNFPAQEVDLKMVDELRNALFPTASASKERASGMDLAAINIQRGRDHGVADLNSVRKHLGLKAHTSFEGITADEEVREKLQTLYTSIDDVDLWVGGLAESQVHQSELGETFHAIMKREFVKIRNGDRFWYQRLLTKEEQEDVEEMTLAEIIRRNTGFTNCPDHVFFSRQNCARVKDHQCVGREIKESNEVSKLKKEREKMNGDYRDLKVLAIVFGVLCLMLLLLIASHFVLTRSKVLKPAPPQALKMEIGKTNDGSQI